MKLTKRHEREASKAHDLYWTSYLNGDVATLTSLLEKDYNQIGSAENEVFFNKKDALEFIEATIGQVAGKVEMRNRVTKSERLDDSYLISEQCDLYVLSDNHWTFYSKFRASSLMQQKPGGWKLVHQHSSVPDLKTQEGENIAIEKITQENLELKNAIKRRTIELEHKNRELEIETALERVRARTMAMQQSDELAEVATLLFQQVRELGIDTYSTGFNVWLNEDTAYQDWVTSPEGGFIEPYIIDTTTFPVFKETADAKQRGDDFFVQYLEGNILKETYEQLMGFAPDQFGKLLEDGFQFPTKQCCHFVFGKSVSLMFITYEPVPESHDIFKRFGKVFEQTYTRFLDLQNAEAQAKEAQIEAALEKIRSKSLAMHQSDDLKGVVVILFEKLKELGLVFDGGAGVKTFKENSNDAVLWVAAPDHLSSPSIVNIPFEKKDLKKNPMLYDVGKARESGTDIFNKSYSFEEKNEYFNFVYSKNDYNQITQSVRDWILQTPNYTGSEVFNHHTSVIINSYSGELITEKQFEILKRIGKVFEQAYIRFLDLQKAEAQARESQIQLALERVRARTMAMQNSNELAMAAQLLFQQFHALGIHTFTCAYMFIEEEKNLQRGWAVVPDGTLLPDFIDFPLSGDPILDDRYQSWKEKRPIHEAEIHGELNKQHHRFLASKVPHQFAKHIVSQLPERVLFYSAYFSQGYLFIVTTTPLSAEEKSIMIRFANVFEQTYTRFLDLQNAEAQAREGQIEAALERVRSSAMAMQSSGDLNTLIGKVFTECTRLDIQLDRGIIMIYDPETLDARWWMANPEAPDNPRDFLLQYHKHVPYLAFLESWKNRIKKWTYVLEGKEKEEWDAFLFVETELALLPAEVKQIMTGFKKVYLNSSFNNFGCLTLATLEPMTDSNFDILLRFAKVFDLTYTRFNDLKLAEAQAREAQIETALERIRAKALAMHQSDELMEVALTLREQMGLLGQKELEASVIHFYNLKKETIQSWHVLNTPGSEKGDLSAGSFEIRKNTCQLTQQFFTEFQSEKTDYSFVVEREVLWEWLEYLESISPEIKESIKGRKPEKAFFHFSKFTDGALLMVSSTPPTEESQYLQKRAAQVFELAYKRYLDLKQAEKLARKAELDLIRLKEEKAKTEDALKELKATQNQLVQQEKLASLGQLTAGIAHEIKNPLNFVNNFSDLSIELVEEMRDEVKEKLSADSYKLTAILDDIEANLRKIHEHGSRADSIVKSMLQHSRGGSGKMEPADVNAVLKEFVNLAFHGMRASKNQINVDVELDLDDSIGKIPLITEDFSRVILNLCNNAFDAMRTVVSMSDNSVSDEYKPKLTVRTKSGNGSVIIEVEDNGSGIPEEIKDKILQPFFTTKKGTQGTGLGLSITHDIVKAHGGEIRLESKIGYGTTFTIILITSTPNHQSHA